MFVDAAGSIPDGVLRSWGMDFSEIPLADVVEYAEADVKVCGEIYLSQLQDLAKAENISLNSVIDLMSDMLMFLCEIEMNGVKIDMEASFGRSCNIEEIKKTMKGPFFLSKISCKSIFYHNNFTKF